jgi:hypothetical protein
MTRDCRLLVEVMRDPRRLTAVPTERWDVLIRQARGSALLARLSALATEHGLLEAIPLRPRRHLAGAALLGMRQQQMVRWEVAQVEDALKPAGIPVILLKGAAYVMAGLPPARGRLFSDVDIMVPRAALGQAERVLGRNGWVSAQPDLYDQRYFRTWMHELPPLRHLNRKTVLDVHHTILPPTARLKPDPRRLLADAVPVAGHQDVYVLAPSDMILHGATHLFFEGELPHGLRDLLDLDDLLRHFGQEPDFWHRLLERARLMDLERPLYYGLRYVGSVLGTAIRADADRQLAPPPAPVRQAMDALYRRVLEPSHPTCASRRTSLARWLLYIRGHYLRMPLRLLLPHLDRKALRRARSPDKALGKGPFPV